MPLLTYKELFYQLFSFKKLSEREIKARHSKRTRAWFIHCIASLFRLVEVSFSYGTWFGVPKRCTDNETSDCLGDYNKRLLDVAKEEFQTTLILMVFVAILLDIASFKWRFMASLILYLELLTRVIASLIPNSYGYASNETDIAGVYVVTMICFYCEGGASILVGALTCGANIFWLDAAYNREIGASKALHNVFFAFFLFIGICATAMVVLHIGNLYEVLDGTNRSNVKMLHSMHEGVLILSKIQDADKESSPELLFSNSKAVKLLNTYLTEDGAGALACHDILSKPNFRRVTLKRDLLFNEHSDSILEESSQVCDLAQIIENQLDKPRQKNCIFLVKSARLDENSSVTTRPKDRYLQIRVKGIEFQQKTAIAVYFQDLTSQIESLHLSMRLLAQEKASNLQNMNWLKLASDLENPLSSVLMICEALLQSDCDGQIRGILAMFVSEINLMLYLVGDMRDIKLLTHGNFTKKQKDFDPRQTFDSILKVFGEKARLQESHLSFHELSESSALCPNNTILSSLGEIANLQSLPNRLSGDEVRLKQVVANLTKNALKHSKQKAVKILAAYDPMGQTLHVQIADQGKGLTQEQFQSIYTSLKRGKVGNQTSCEQDSGVGIHSDLSASSSTLLGTSLSICKQIVERYEGEIQVASKGLSFGTTFTFSMRMLDPAIHSDQLISSSAAEALEESKQGDSSSDTASLLKILEQSSAVHVEDLSEMGKNQSFRLGDSLDLEASVAHRSRRSQRQQQSLTARSIRGPQFDMTLDEKEVIAKGNKLSLNQGNESEEESDLSFDLASIYQRNKIMLQEPEASLRKDKRPRTGAGVWVSDQLGRQMQGGLAQGFIGALPDDLIDSFDDVDSERAPALGESVALPKVVVATDNVFNGTAIFTLLRQYGVDCTMLNQYGHLVAHEKNRLAQSGYTTKLILLDQNFKEFNGFESARRLRLLYQRKGVEPIQQPFICLLTTNDSLAKFAQDELRCLGVNDYMAQPIFKDQILRLLRKVNLIPP